MRVQLLLSLLFLLSISIHTALAQVTAPSQGGEVGLILATANTLELRFGTTGNGQGRVIAIAPTSNNMPTPLAPSNGVFYQAAPSYGQGSAMGKGFVVYNGPGHAVTVTGLKPNTNYYITDTEYNTDGSSILYNTYGISMSVSTRAASPVVVTPLPVVLTSFTGTVDTRNLATLRWTTATEQNTAYFALERSVDGVAFTEVGQVAAATTSDKSRDYQYLDKQALHEATHYRLRQVDQDGTFRYSQVITLSPIPTVNSVQLVDVYPNPSAGQPIQLLMQGYQGKLFQAHVTDALGRTVLNQQLTPTTASYLIPLLLPSPISSGTYILSLISENKPIQKRITISN